MKYNKHGIISIVIAFLAFALAIVAISFNRFDLAFVYILIILTGFLIIMYSYCTKCEGRFSCGHVIIGKIAQWLPCRKNSPYTNLDYLGVILPFLIIVILPQIWLWKIKWMFVSFWILLIVAALEINKYVCNRCVNTKCVMCKNKCMGKVIKD
jgi:hypothetical protein